MDHFKPFSGRRHSVDAVALANMSKSPRSKPTIDISSKLFPNKPTQNRRHSMMLNQPSPTRRPSLNPFAFRRTSRNFSMFSIQQPTTFTGLPCSPPKIEMENTYQLEPEQNSRYREHVIREAAQEVLDRVLEETGYMDKETETSKTSWSRPTESSEGGRLAKNLVTEVKEKLKTLEMKRYKFVVTSYLGENKGQGLMIASRSLWNTETDGHVTVQRKTASQFAVVVVHALYYP